MAILSIRLKPSVAPVAFAVFIAVSSIGAYAQVALFNPEDYGKADLPFSESTGDAAAFVAAQEGAFEPIHELPVDDPIRRAAHSIGRIDLLVETQSGKRSMATCTGIILTENWAMTNYHCIPGNGESHLVAASILMEYLVLGGQGATRYGISTKPRIADRELDFSLVELLDKVDPSYPVGPLGKVDASPGEPLIIIQHPLGRPEMMTRFRCFAVSNQAGDFNLRHRCDTLPGSSGSIVFNRNLSPVALHKAGGMMPEDDKSFNLGTRITAIIDAIDERSGITLEGQNPAPARQAPQEPSAKTQENDAPGPGLGPGAINDLLRRN